jgi:hypothetical protein
MVDSMIVNYSNIEDKILFLYEELLMLKAILEITGGKEWEYSQYKEHKRVTKHQFDYITATRRITYVKKRIYLLEERIKKYTKYKCEVEEHILKMDDYERSMFGICYLQRIDRTKAARKLVDLGYRKITPGWMNTIMSNIMDNGLQWSDIRDIIEV